MADFIDYTWNDSTVSAKITDAPETVRTHAGLRDVNTGDVIIKTDNPTIFDVLSPTEWASTGYSGKQIAYPTPNFPDLEAPMRVVFRGNDEWDFWDGFTGQTRAKDNGGPLQNLIEKLPDNERVLIELPHSSSGLYFSQGVYIPSNIMLVSYAKLINDANISGVGNKLFVVEDASDWYIYLHDVEAIAYGTFDPNVQDRNPQVAISMEGRVDRGTIVARRLWNHQNFAIQYADSDTNPANSWLRDVDIKATIGGECGPSSNGSGINCFMRAQNGTVPTSRNLHVDLNIDVSRGSADQAQHGPQAFKISNIDGITGKVIARGGDIASVVLTNGCRNIRDFSIHSYRSNTGLTITGTHSQATTLTRDITASLVYVPEDVNGDRYAAVLGQFEGLDLTVEAVESDIRIQSDGLAEPANRWNISGRCRNITIVDPGSAHTDIENSTIDLELVGDGAGSHGRAILNTANWNFSRSNLNLRLVNSGGAYGSQIGGIRNTIAVSGRDCNPTNLANWPLLINAGTNNIIKQLENLGGNVDYHYRMTRDAPAQIDGPIIGTVDTSPIDLVGITELIGAPMVIWHPTVFVLPGAALEEWVFTPAQDYVLVSVLHLYFRDTSADAGINLRVGTSSGGISSLDVTTSLSSVSEGTLGKQQNTADLGASRTRRVLAGDSIRVKSDGGKIGVGAVRFGLILVPALDI